MRCYFLNCRSFKSKNGKDCYMITVSTPDGMVSDFFVSKESYEIFKGVKAFDFVNLDISFSRAGAPTIHGCVPLEGGECV